MSISTTYRCRRPPRRRIASSASVALFFGRKPYEQVLKSASKIGSTTTLAAACTTRSRTVGIPNGRCVPSVFGMYCRLTGCGQYMPVRRRCCTPRRNVSTPSCSIIDSVSPSTPAAPLFALTLSHASARTSLRQIRSYNAWKRRFRLCLAAMKSPRWSCRTFNAGLLGVATMPSRLPPGTGTTKAGPSRSSGFHHLRRYYGPLGLPLDTAGFRLRLIPTAFAQRGPSRRVYPVPHQAIPACRLPYPGSVLRPLRSSVAVCCLRPDMTGSATSPFGFFSHGAAKFTLSHSAHRFASLAQDHTAFAGLSTLRSDARIPPRARSLLRGAPALTAAGLPPASLMQHLGRTVQARPRSRRTTAAELTVVPVGQAV